MPTAYFGTSEEPGFDLAQSEDLIVVRAASGRGVPRTRGSVPLPLAALLADATLVQAHPEVGVEVYRLPAAASVTERARALDAAPEVRFAGHALVDPGTGEPVLYTENLFVKFADDAGPAHCAAVLAAAGLRVKEVVGYAVNAYFTAAPDRTGQRVFTLAAELLARADVEFAHPELIRRRARKAIAPQQWHLRATAVGGVPVDAHANVEAAHEITRGAGVTIAIVDDGIDIDHPEFARAGKVVAPRDVTAQNDDPRPKDQAGTGPDADNHGTACAGVACADGSAGASGVAPEARLLPIRLASGLGSQAEARAFQWAADNGADIISCSWGPADGAWFDPRDPLHQRVVPMPAGTRLALEYATGAGRGGRGCVVFFAAGNGNESVDNDGYAAHPHVLAVAACNDRGTRSVYSDTGAALAVAFPSNDIEHAPFGHPAPLTPGIWTVDRRGRAGYSPGDYTPDFGGTSSACPGAAGVAALVLAVNPVLTRTEVRDILTRTCDRIDPEGGGYDANGHSTRYGHGRLNARRAVEAAR